jgi:hypothetical protein
MLEIITQEHVILYIYNELEANMRPIVERAIASEPDLLKFYQKAVLLLSELDKINDEPSETTISILNEEARSNSFEVH